MTLRGNAKEVTIPFFKVGVKADHNLYELISYIRRAQTVQIGKK